MSKDNAKGEYDAKVKEILSYKCILARIMKYTVEELQGYSEEEIISFIEGTPAVAEEPLYGEASSRVFGVESVDTKPGEGVITLDIVFTVYNNPIKMYINVEAQNNAKPGYDIVTRAVYYCARMLSKQYGREFNGSDYNGIKKVYSIWICTSHSYAGKNAITKYSIKPETVYGSFNGTVRYDLLSVVMIGLENGSDNKLIQFLYDLLTDATSKEEKRKLIADEFGEKVARQMEGGIGVMCNLSEYIEEKALERGIELGIEQGIGQGIEQGIEQGRNQGREQGKLQAIIDMYLEGDITYDIALKRIGSKELLDELIASRAVCV